MYPLRVNYFSDAKAQGYRFVENQAELLKVYDKVFHSSVKTYIANTNAEDVWGNDYFLQTGYGQIGIYVKTTGDCPACTFDMKVKIIASNTIYRESVEDIFGNPLNGQNNP